MNIVAKIKSTPSLSPFAKYRERKLTDESEETFASEGFRSRRSVGRRYPEHKLVGASFALGVVIFFGILSARSLFGSGYFIMHDDLQMMRQLEMEKCFLDGQIPCRWVPDMGYGFGFPLFNYYPPLPYLIGEVFRIFGFPFTTSVKLTFALSLVASGVAMYLLAKEFFGKVGGVVSAVFYMWAPYHAVDVFVRGAMNESWALVFFPLILWLSYKLIKDKVEVKKWVVFLSLSYSLLLTSHNLMVLIFTPILAIWVLMHLVLTRDWRKLLPLFLAGAFALGMAAFFTFPSFLEQKFVNVSSLVKDYYDYSGHFVTVRQLFFSRFWGDGSSAFGEENDMMSFSLGHFHWILSLSAGLLLLLRFLQNKGSLIERIKKDSLFIVTFFFLTIGWFSAFMTHSRSTPIWQSIDILRFVQFPWRFLTLSILGMSFAVGAIPPMIGSLGGQNFFKKILILPFQFLVPAILIFCVIFFNWNYFKPVRVGPVTDSEKFSGEAWRLQQGAGIRDYLPISAKFDPREARKTLAEVMEGEAGISSDTFGTYWAKFNATIESDSAKVRLNIFSFPFWRVFVKIPDEIGSGRELSVFIPEEEEWGRIWIEIPKGEYFVYAQLFNTNLRTASNIISLITLGGLILYISIAERKWPSS